MRVQHILLITLIALLFFSCVKEPYEQPQGGPGDGTATRITLAIKSDSRQAVGYRGAGAQTGYNGATSQAGTPGALPSQVNPASLLSRGLPSLSGIPGTRALTPEQETLIANVHILIFDAEGAIAANEHFDNLSITGTSNIPLETTPGENMQIVVVANGDVNDHTGTTLDAKLKSVTSIDELNALLVNIDGDGLSRTERLMMVGSSDPVTITKPHNTPIPVELHFLDTKVTLTVKDNVTASGEQITITGWDIVNIPKKSYLKERTAPEDAVVGTTPGDYTATNGKYNFGSIDPAAKTYAHTVYLFENRRGGRVERTDPTNPADKYPGMGVSDNDQRGKAWYAPAGATCMLIYGTYTKDGQMNNVVYKVYLGENPIDDYNLFRRKHYNYNVTVNGLNNINVDTNVEWGAASFSVDHSQNLEMDAHPDFRVFRIAGTAVDATTPAYATVEVLESDGTTPCTWLAVSPVNLYRHAVKQSGNADQQFDAGNGSGTYVRTRYKHEPTPESEFSAATFAMTRKLTKIPFNQPAVYTYQNAIVYADAWDGTTDRTAKVKITYYKGVDGTEKAGEQTYDVTQSGAIQVSPDLYIERYEESAMLMHPGLASGLQNTATMQWGYNTATLYAATDRFTNGNWLTANAVYNTVAARNGMTAPSWTATAYAAYREKYPRAGAKVTEPSALNTTGAPYYYPDLVTGTQPSDYFHPIFNSSAARYCHEKNRDTDGDGIISAEETIWYLPSFADMWYISKNMPAGLNLTGTYWTSTEENNTNSWGYTFPTPTPTSSVKTTPYRVRCVRGTGAVLPDATIESTETDKTKITLSSTAGVAGAFNIADATGLPWNVTVSPEATWLKIATAATGSGASASVNGTSEKTLYAYVATANTSTTENRSATITLTPCASETNTITVMQRRNIAESTVNLTALAISSRAGESAAFYINNKASGLEWTVTVNDDAKSWLAIAKDDTGSGAATSQTGVENTQLYAYSATENTSLSTPRTGTLTFSRAEQASIVLQVEQYSLQTLPPMHNGWAGCNVYWDAMYINDDGSKGRLTFTDTGDASKQTYQGVYFRFGSLVPIAPALTFDPLKHILFSPNGDAYESYGKIPKPTIPNDYAIADPDNNAMLRDIHDHHTNQGDICRYITDKGWAPGSTEGKRWRLPTTNELKAALGTPISSGANKQKLPSPKANGTSYIAGYIQSEEGLPYLRLPQNGITEQQGSMYFSPWYKYIGASYSAGSWDGSANYGCPRLESPIQNAGNSSSEHYANPMLVKRSYDNGCGIRCVLE